MVNFFKACFPINLCFERAHESRVVAAAGVRTYVMVPGVPGRRIAMTLMATTANRSRPLLLLLAGLGGAVMAATLGLWAYYGTAVFFEIVRTGWVACF